MVATLIVLGVGLLLAGLLGGGVEFWKMKIPRIPKFWERIAVCILGVLLLLAGLWTGFGGGVNAVARDTPPAETEPPPPPPPPSSTLVGTLDLLHHTEVFRDRHTDYSITASAGQTREFPGEISLQGLFRIPSVPDVPRPTVSWGVSRPSEFVIWPLAHPEASPGEELRFRFELLHDRFAIQKGLMLGLVRSGDFAGAVQRLRTLLELFDRLGIRGAPTEPIVGIIARWRFTIHRDLIDVASEVRATLGRSQLAHEHVRIEREWRRAMIFTALTQPAPGQRFRDFVRAANSWASYSRDVYSRSQDDWPDRSLASRENGDTDFLEDVRYADWLREDIALIKDKLNDAEIRVLVNEHVNPQSPMDRLSDGQRKAVQSVSNLLEQDASRVSLNGFVNLLAALHRLVILSAG